MTPRCPSPNDPIHPTIDGVRPPINTVALALLALCLALAAAGSIGCRPSPTTEHTFVPPTLYAVTGVVQRLQPDGRTAVIRHDAIPDYMQAMTMPFVVRDQRQLRGLTPGDQIVFRLLVTETDAWIDRVRKTGRHETVKTSTPDDLLSLVDELEAGDPLPDCTLVDDQGRSFQVSDLRGRVVGMTFLFTRCPLPTYCPLMSRHFAAAHQELLATHTQTPWHLLTLSFDPDFDTPRVLGMYARQYRTDTNHWTFATGDQQAVEQFGRSLGLMLVREPGTISHNLRTLVITPSGHIHHVFRDNDWSPTDLVAQMIQAAPDFDLPPTSNGPSPATTRIAISGMSCEACARAIQNAFRHEPGVTEAAVVYDRAQATVVYDPERTAPARLLRLLQELNYNGTPLPGQAHPEP